PDTPAERLQELADTTQSDIIISGHSHRTFKQKVDGVWFINTGSVGRPDDGDPRAAYAIMHLRPRFFQIRHYRIEYDVERAVDSIREKGLPEAFAQMIQQGRSLDYILENADIQQEKEILQDIPISDFKPDEQTLKSIMELAQSCEYEAVHTKQVTDLALRLFDELRPVHYLDEKEKFWLQAGALLHDIGWIEGQKGHHKTSLRIILGNSILTMDNHERLVIGSIARYHRKALPKMKHSHYNALHPIERQTVSMLAGILRVADGLDRTHQSIVRDLKCDINKNKITIICSVDSPAGIEHQAALKKSDLMEKVFKRKVIFKFQDN
ncbi:HD domain-containing protein, partial [Candidatus Poribacteria bacterium]|nr:HD domain-containing protein [Candidatus Poribacteria bacterium]